MSSERPKQVEDATPSASQLKSAQKPQEPISRSGMQQGQQVQPQQAQRPSSVQPVSSTPMTMPQTTSQPQAVNSKGSKAKSATPKKGNSPVQFIALGVSVVALILAIVGFVVPSMNASSNNSNDQGWKYTKLSDSFTIAAGSSANLPAEYPTASTDYVLITGYGYDGMRFTQIVPGVNVSLMVPDSASTIGKLDISTTDSKMSNPTSQSITITGIYKISNL